MLELTLPDMTCGGCARGVTAAIKAVDPAATVEADPAAHSVRVTTGASPEAVKTALTEAGFPPA